MMPAPAVGTVVRIAASISPLGIILSTSAPNAEVLRAAIRTLLDVLGDADALERFRFTPHEN
jgi:hypothetical protein